MILLFGLLLVGASPESDLLEEDVTFPADYTWSELLAELRASPVDLNSAPGDQLLLIPLLSPQDVQAILEYRKTGQRFRDPAELRQIAGIDPGVIELIRPYVAVRDLPVKARGQLVVRLGLDSLTSGNRFFRSAHSGRIRADLGTVDAAFVGAKDPGESDALDFLGGGLEFNYKAFRLVLGDYELHFGQGLAFSRPHAYARSANMLGSALPAAAYLPGAASENAYLAGLSWSQRWGAFTSELFAARNRWDAVLNADSTIRTITYDGRHDDSAARANKDRLGEDLLGARLAGRASELTAGMSGYVNRYDRTVRSGLSGPGFEGRSMAVLSSDISYRFRNYVLGLDVGHSLGHGWAGALTLRGEWERLRTALELVYLESDFYSPHSRSRTLRRPHDDLEGKLRLSYRAHAWHLDLYGTTAQDFAFDSMPARLELGLGYRGSAWQFGLGWKQAYKDESPATTGSRFDLSYRISRCWALLVRCEDRFTLQQAGERGVLLAFGGSYEPAGLDLEAKAGRFFVSSPSVRVYTFEPGFPGNNVALVGNGWRGYLAGTATLARRLRVRAKLGITSLARINYDGGLGLDLSLGN